MRAEGQQDLLGLGGVGVVSVLVEPLLERPRHVLQGLALVSHFAAAGTTPVGEQVDREPPDTKPQTCYDMAHTCTHETFIYRDTFRGHFDLNLDFMVFFCRGCLFFF